MPTTAAGRAIPPRPRPGWSAHEPVTVLELGAGTGKLTEALVALGHDVHATDPDDAMLAVLRGAAARRPHLACASAEELPAADASYDVVVAAQAFHWFDHDRALPEIARVLRPGGQLALVWNQRDERIPWVRKLGRAHRHPGPAAQRRSRWSRRPCFGDVEDDDVPALAADRPRLDPGPGALPLQRRRARRGRARSAKLAEVLAFYDDYGRGMDGMQLPYVTPSCFRAIGRRAAGRRAPADEHAPSRPRRPGAAGDGADTDDVLLIDFR